MDNDFGAGCGKGGYNDYHKGVSSVSIFESDWLDTHRVLYIWFIYGHEVKRKLPPLNTELWLVDTHNVPVATLFEWVSLHSRARADSRSAGQFGNFPPSHPALPKTSPQQHLWVSAPHYIMKLGHSYCRPTTHIGIPSFMEYDMDFTSSRNLWTRGSMLRRPTTNPPWTLRYVHTQNDK